MKRDKAPISILMISAAYESQGGVATHLNYLSHALTEIEGIKKVTVLTMRRSNSQTKIQPGNPYIWRSEFDDHQSQPGRRAIYDKILTDALNNWKKYPHDIIHAHDLDSIFVGLLLKTAFNKPIVATIHRAPTKWKHERYKDSPKDLFMQLMLTYRTIDRIVVPSLSSMEVLKDQGFNPKNIKLIKHGIDYEKYVTSFKSDDELVNRLNAVDLSPNIGPFTMAAFGFAREFATWAETIFSPGDLRQAMPGEFLALFQGVGYQEAIQVSGHCHQC